MKRKRITEVFPWLLPLRKRQRECCFYAKMALDKNKYATTTAEPLPFLQCKKSNPLYNQDTGFDMKYQENKVFNLHLTANKLDGLLIRPGETFSFWKAVRYADREIPYKEGLTVVDGKLMTTSGGGLCQMSNLLFGLFLDSPLAIVERKGHRKKEFPDPGGTLAGTDATVSEGWIDLKVKNITESAYQLQIGFDEETLYGYLRCEKKPQFQYQAASRGLRYWKKDDSVYECVAIYRQCVDGEDRSIKGEEKLYDNCCKIEYPLPESVFTEKEKNNG